MQFPDCRRRPQRRGALVREPLWVPLIPDGCTQNNALVKLRRDAVNDRSSTLDADQALGPAGKKPLLRHYRGSCILSTDGVQSLSDRCFDQDRAGGQGNPGAVAATGTVGVKRLSSDFALGALAKRCC
jgi:hypothetical protein